MSTFRDYLYYNLLYVGLFVQGVQKLIAFYSERAIDLFKTTISVSGVARALLFQTARENHVHFSLFDNTQQDLYKMFKDNITAGPSLVFNRELEAGKTLLGAIQVNFARRLLVSMRTACTFLLFHRISLWAVACCGGKKMATDQKCGTSIIPMTISTILYRRREFTSNMV